MTSTAAQPAIGFIVMGNTVVLTETCARAGTDVLDAPVGGGRLARNPSFTFVRSGSTSRESADIFGSVKYLSVST